MKNIKLSIAIALTVFAGSNLMAAGDAAAGKEAFGTCVACHGANGEGNQAMNAPKLAGQEAWYVASSLKRFKDGTRGKDDPIAMTMVPMAQMLNDQQIEDLAAYIATLK